MDSHLIIKRLMERKKLEQADLANVLKVTPKTAHNYLNGHTKITIDQIPVIVKFLKVPYDVIFEDKDLNTLEEPIMDYSANTDYKALCDQKDETIKAKNALITHLEGQVEFLKGQLEK